VVVDVEVTVASAVVLEVVVVEDVLVVEVVVVTAAPLTCTKRLFVQPMVNNTIWYAPVAEGAVMRYSAVMSPVFGLRSWGELSVTLSGLIVNFAVSLSFVNHCCSPGTTPVAAMLSEVAFRLTVCPGARVKPEYSLKPVPLNQIPTPLLWQ
jgi:hypothetical protein